MAMQPKQSSTTTKNRDAERHLIIVRARNKRIIILTLSLCLFAMAVAGLMTALYLWSQNQEVDDKILDNVIVGGMNIGGMTKEDAINAVSLAVEPKLTKQSLVVRLDNDTLELTPDMTGIVLDVEDLVDAAFAYGRTGTKLEQSIAKAQAKTKEHTIALLPYLRLNLSKIRSAVETFCDGYSVEMVEPTISIDGPRPHYVVGGNNTDVVHQTLIITMGSPESYLDPNDLYYAILDAYSLLQMELRYAVPVLVEPEKLDAQKIFSQYCIAPADAVLDPITFEVTPEVYGYGFNVHMLQRLIDRAEYGQTLEIVLDFLLPDITAEALAGDLFQDLLVSYTAGSSGSSSARNQNLATSCAKINGLVIKAGETFDFNEVLGPRTVERGYASAISVVLFVLMISINTLAVKALRKVGS